MTSYDVKAPFTSVPMDSSIKNSQTKITTGPTAPIKDQHVHTTNSHRNIYFLFKGKYYEQVHGAAMGLPIRPLIANLFMKEFEVMALSYAPHPSPVVKVCG